MIPYYCELIYGDMVFTIMKLGLPYYWVILLGNVFIYVLYKFRQKFLKGIGLEPCVLVSPHRRKPSRGGPKC